MELSVEEIELAIRGKLEERQGHLDQANGCAGAVAILQGLLAEANKADTKLITTVDAPEAKSILRRLKK